MYDDPPRLRIIVLVLALAVVSAAPFLVDVNSTEPVPVDFDETVSIGLSLEERQVVGSKVSVPQAQVFYSQYQYVTGYYGVERFVHAHNQDGHSEQFGYPLRVYVTDFSGTELELTDDGYPTTAGSEGWVDATAAAYVIDSDSRTPAGETIVPFSNRADAEAFAASHGGEVVDWETVLDTPVDVNDAVAARDRVDSQRRAAGERAESVTSLRDRPTSVVVGEDANTIQDAVDMAPANTTIVVPAGIYEETIEIDRPITLAGDTNATIHGNGNGSVIDVTVDRTAVTGLEITGVGNETSSDRAELETAADEWEHDVELGYGHGDAGIAVVGASTVLVADVAIETPANGVLLRDSPHAVVRNITVDGSDEWKEGFMGVMAMRSPATVENSTFRDGRDGIYTHRSGGIVIRNNTMINGRFGVHLMYTSNALVVDNSVHGQELAGIVVMTSPVGNAILGNDVRDAPNGIRTGGSNSYVAENVIAGTELGLTTAAADSLYEHNVLMDNDVGIHASSVLPSNRVIANDFLDNDQHTTVSVGPLRIWTSDDSGNYWEGTVGSCDGETLDRSYSPTDPVDRHLHTVDGTPTLARSPALETVASLEGAVPGARGSSVVDTAPLCRPANLDLLERANRTASKANDEVSTFEATP
ncbi:right-handed parallel beta-helix repeat-containing protein [Halobacteria archaeon AArc-m2/3/4]|uniref:Right-handed parallel beta-helix repeat-containing protein n=1 Tax=Natronoglomus mannanivorans TaxID=2979990 RepID=A0AAP2Z1V4_9EURY|nr:right-handed parallel beta-helix repeat-containing protein [Halobacteria archaeon AArc-xg1-1]MCU4975814.1 right-handed parallel beta-helix repeat-containing protein [Halobacteria archaeon AArc-m2/3/4]